MAGAPRTWEHDLLAACLWVGGVAVVSHRAAAALHRLRGFDPGPIEVSGDKNAPRPGVIVHHILFRYAQRIVVSAIPVSTAARTLLDLGAVVPASRVEDALDDALRRGLVSLDALHRMVEEERGKGRRGVGVLRKLLELRPAAAAPTESVLEGRALRLILGAGLPRPVTQHEVRDGARLVARVDLAYPDALVAVEVDGYSWHSGRSDWQRDMARGNALAALGWTVLHITAEDIRERPEDAVATIRASLSKSVRKANGFG